MANVCGTGLFDGPKPGDPDNNLSISATSVFGGINVTWSYPTINPSSVAHFIVYRSSTSSFNSALEIGRVSGSIYFDRLNPTTDTQYFYWIKLVSTNGTVNSPIGPASATARPIGDQTLETLTGRIDSGVLAQSLKSQIEQIGINRAYFDQQITTLQAEDTSLSQAIDFSQSYLDGNIAAVQTNMQTQITTINGQVVDIGALWTAKVSVNGLVGGFGIYNDGRTVEAGFDVDLFWVGRTNSNKVKPFVIYNDTVYIDKARIRDADIDTLKIAGKAITVSSYDEGEVALGYLGGSSLGSTAVEICLINLAVTGMAANEKAGTIITGVANLMDGGGSGATIVARIVVNDVIIGASAVSLGESKSVTATAYAELPNGTHKIQLMICTDPATGAASKNLYCKGSLITMAGKR